MAPATILPQLPSRLEIVEFANAHAPTRREPVTVAIVKRWDAEGLINRHFQGAKPIRYNTQSVRDFFAGVTK